MEEGSYAGRRRVGKVEEAEFLYLTTTGRRSGLPREIEIWQTHGDTGWVANAGFSSASIF